MFKKVLPNEYFQKNASDYFPSSSKGICSKKYQQTNTFKKMQAITFQVIAKEYVQKNASDY